MQELSHLVDNNRSPLLSVLIDTERYMHEKMPLLEEFYNTEDAYKTPYDKDIIMNDLSKLKEARNEISKIYQTLISMKLKVFNTTCDLEDKGLTNGA